MAVKLTKSTLKKIDDLHAALASARSKGVRAHPESLSKGIGAKGAGDIKQLGKDIMGAVIPLTSRGTPANPVEAAAAKLVADKGDEVRNKIADLLAKGQPNPADYYDILHKVLADSGSVLATDPKVIRKALDEVQASGSCGACSACSACSVCSICSASVVEGTIATGIVGATITVWT